MEWALVVMSVIALFILPLLVVHFAFWNQPASPPMTPLERAILEQLSDQPR